MRQSAILRALEQLQQDVYTSPFKAKKSWPPDLEKLSRTEQFRLERRYRRRTKLKWARPGWTKAVKVVQLGTIACQSRMLFMTSCQTNQFKVVLVYGVLFQDWKQENPPFQGVSIGRLTCQ